MLRMKSKLHGFTHADDGNQEAYLRKLGWIGEDESFEPENKAEGDKAPIEIDLVTTVSAPIVVRRTRGPNKPKG